MLGTHVVWTTGVKYTTLEQDNYAPQMPLYLIWTLMNPSHAELTQATRALCLYHIPTEIYMAVVDWSRICKLVSLFIRYTHKYTRIQELIVWPCGFLKYAHKSQGGMHLATQDAHLLNYNLLKIWKIFKYATYVICSVSKKSFALSQ